MWLVVNKIYKSLILLHFQRFVYSIWVIITRSKFDSFDYAFIISIDSSTKFVVAYTKNLLSYILDFCLDLNESKKQI